MTWADADDVRDILKEAEAATSYWNDDDKINPYIVGAERYLISRLAPHFGFEDLEEWQSDDEPPGILVEISANRAAYKILTTNPTEDIPESTLSRLRKDVEDNINYLISGESAIYDKNGVEYRVTVGGVVSAAYNADEYPFPVNPRAGDESKKFRW